MVAVTPDSPPVRLGLHLSPGVKNTVVQFSILAGAAALYFGVRNVTHGEPHVATAHARDLMRFEDSVGLHHEAAAQGLILGHRWLITLFNDIYIYGHWPVIVAVLTWLFIRHREQFALARNSLLISGAVALPIFAFYPVAPPRFADPAVVDTVTLHDSAYRVLQPPSFTNLYAAMPSLHCGWDLIVGLCLAAALSHRIAANLVRLLPLAMVVAVVVTGNHYIVDAIAGDVIAFGALVVAHWMAQRRTENRLPDRIEEPMESRVA